MGKLAKKTQTGPQKVTVGYTTFAYYVILMFLAWIHINMEIYSMVHL